MNSALPSIAEQIAALQGAMQPPKSGPAQQQADKVFAAIKAGDGTIARIKNTTGLTTSRVVSAIYTLHDAGLIDFVWRGKTKYWRPA